MTSRMYSSPLVAFLLAVAISVMAVAAVTTAEPQIKAGDKIVVVENTHVQAGEQKLVGAGWETAVISGCKMA